MTTRLQKLAPLPDPPEGNPEDKTNFNQTNVVYFAGISAATLTIRKLSVQ